MPQAKRATSVSLEEYAYTELRDMIQRGELGPGEQLLQVELSKQLGISRTPLRRALATLQHERLIEFSPRGEAFVTRFRAEEVADMFEVRAVLEGLSCRLAATTIEAKHTAYLRSLLEAAFEVSSASDASAYRQADIEFHTYLAKLGSNPFLQDLLDAYHIMHLSFAQGLLRTPAETFHEHLRILDALGRNDPDAAEQEMRQHIRTTVTLLRQRASAPDAQTSEPQPSQTRPSETRPSEQS